MVNNPIPEPSKHPCEHMLGALLEDGIYKYVLHLVIHIYSFEYFGFLFL